MSSTTPKRRLVIIRHAKSAQPFDVPDQQRPLADRGRREAPTIGRWLREHLDQLDLVICSPATRARETWQLAAAEMPDPPRVVYEPRLYAASEEDLLDVVRQLPDEARAVALVAHNPGLEELVAVLTGVYRELKTSGVAVVSWSGPWADAQPGRATLEEHAAPQAARKSSSS
jgi:phosphohistidine phosphatase